MKRFIADIETVYYSGLLDSTIQSPMICYACSDKVSDESFIKYVDEKKMHSIVFPTFGIDICNKNNAKKFIYKRGRKADKNSPMRREWQKEPKPFEPDSEHRIKAMTWILTISR